MKTFRTDPDRFGIRARLLTLLLPGILGLLALDSWNDYRALHNLVQDAYDQVMLESVNALRGSLAVGSDGSLQLNSPSLVQAMFEAASPQHKHLHVGLTPHLPESGTQNKAAAPLLALTLLGEADLPKPPQPAGLPASSSGPASAVWYDGYYRDYPVRVVAIQSQVVDGRGQRFDLLIQAAESTLPRAEAQAATLRQQLLRDTRMVLVVIVLVWLGVTWSLQPLERLRKSVLQSQGHALQPLDTSGVPHEVAPLVEAVNQHVASYRDLLDQQSQFLADASHQLRTPLAIMLTQAGVALREKDPTQLHETLRAIVIQISRSRRLCEQLLSLAHASDSTPSADQPTVVDLNAIARDVVLQYLTLAHEKNQDLGWVNVTLDDAHDASRLTASAPVFPVLAIGPELHEALANLVHNAIAYTPRGGHITVMVSAQGGMALAEVLDNGPGIAQTRREDVFKRFHHASPGTAKGRHGAGLGLAIARAYAQRNGGDIALADVAVNPNDIVPGMPGLRVILSVPLVTS
jgi:two-component system sensor histidine kinase TctE